MDKEAGIFIPSYKNERHELFNYIMTDDLKNYNIFLFLSENDEHLKEYYEYDFPQNVTIIVTDCKTIGEKRQRILNFAKEHNFKYVIELDDDVRSYGYNITPESKRPTSDTYHKFKIPLVEVIDELVKNIKTNEYAFISPTFPFSIGFNKPGKKFVNSALNFSQFIAINVDTIFDSNIEYDPSAEMIEDADLVFKLLQHGKFCATLGDYAYEVHRNSLKSYSSIVNTTQDIFNRKQMNFYLRYGDGIKLGVRDNGEIKMTIQLKKYWNTFEIPIKDDDHHRKIREFCISKDVEGLKKYILETTTKK